MSPKLSIVIPFLNEGEELHTTLSQIRDTAGDNVDIIVVNDASTDGYDYHKVVEEFGVRYVKHKERQGSGASKQEGIMLSKTPYFIVFDAHMRFYDTTWWSEICSCLENNPNAIYCLKCKPWNAETKTEFDIPVQGGARADVSSKDLLSFLNLHWLKIKECSDAVSPVPCVLGACYASSVDYWKKIRGFEGLEGYGCEEIYISLKAWLEGGGCYLINKVTVGHLFRDEFPYVVGKNENLFNILYVVDVLLPDEYRIWYLDLVKHALYMAYRQYVSKNRDRIDEAKKYYSTIFKENGFQRFLELNKSFKQ